MLSKKDLFNTWPGVGMASILRRRPRWICPPFLRWLKRAERDITQIQLAALPPQVIFRPTAVTNMNHNRAFYYCYL